MSINGDELLEQLRFLEARVRELVHLRMHAGRDPNDPFRGLYITDDAAERELNFDGQPLLPQVDLDLDVGVFAGDSSEPVPGRTICRLRSRDTDPFALVRKRFGLRPIECLLLVLAAAPSLDRRYGTLFAYLNDDATQPRATVGLAHEICGLADTDVRLRGLLGEDAPLVSNGLVTVDHQEAYFFRRSLHVDDDVVAMLLSNQWSCHLGVTNSGVGASPLIQAVSSNDASVVASMLSRGSGFVYLDSGPGLVARALGEAAFTSLGLGCVSLDLEATVAPEDIANWVRVLLRQATIAGSGIVAGPIDHWVDDKIPLVRLLADADFPIVLTGQIPWSPHWSHRLPHIPSTPSVNPSGCQRILEAVLSDTDGVKVADAGRRESLGSAFAQFTLRPEEVVRALRYALFAANADDRPLDAGDIEAGVRMQNSHGLERLTRRIHPVADWSQIVVPRSIELRLRDLVMRARHRHTVIDRWGMRPGGGRGSGVVGLFFGDSGTGKTLAAEVVAHELGLELFVINLATVVDKYIGETEKNLEAIFEQAAEVNGVLFFDEADALFGKRSEGGDAHDRYANIEVAYLLQKVETFDGLAILATNLRANMDPAFVRRIDVVIDFPSPGFEQRLALWQRYLPRQLSLDASVDVEFLAKSFRLTGGSIQNTCIASAFRAYADDGVVTMKILVQAIQQEFEKLGRLCVEADFGPYFELIERPQE